MARDRSGGIAAAVALAVGVGMAAGCGRGGTEPAAPIEPPFRGVELRVVVLGEPGLAAVLDDRRGEWERSRGGSIRIRAADVGQAPAEAAAGADLIVFPGDLLGALIDADALRELPDAIGSPAGRPTGAGVGDESEAIGVGPDPDDLGFDEIFPPYREEVSSYGRRRVALPLGGSALVLAYRADALADEATRAEAEAAGVSLDPPTTWEQLDALARFLHGRDRDGDGRPEAGIALALGPDDSDRLGVETLVARAAALGLHRDYFSLLFDPDTMAPRLTSPPFVEALEGLVALRDAGPEGMAAFDAEAARAAFRSGAALLLIDRAERYADWLEQGDESEVGVARLPGSGRMFEAIRGAYDPADPPNRPGYLPNGGGWLVGVGSSSGEPAAAQDLALYLIERDTAARLRVDPRVPMLPVRSPLIGQGPALGRERPGLSRRDWSDAVSRTILADRVLIGLRIPGAREYLADLGEALAAASSDASSPADALRAAADSWESRTVALGRARQTWHYRRSLNSLTTSSRPPPR